MTTGPPLVRARHPQTILQLAQARAPDIHAAILASLSSDMRSAIEDTLALVWLPIEIDIAAMEALARHFPPLVVGGMVAARQREEIGSPLFSGLLKTVLTVAGNLTRGIVPKHFPRAWKQLFTDCGTLESDGADDAALRMVIRALPRVCLASDAWMSGVPVGFQAVCDTLGLSADVTAGRPSAAGDLPLVFRWKA